VFCDRRPIAIALVASLSAESAGLAGSARAYRASVRPVGSECATRMFTEKAPMLKVNVDDVPWATYDSPSGTFRGFYKELSLTLGAKKGANQYNGGHPFDLTIEKIESGGTLCPYHSHATKNSKQRPETAPCYPVRGANPPCACRSRQHRYVFRARSGACLLTDFTASDRSTKYDR
jgi:hypothetical protein